MHSLVDKEDEVEVVKDNFKRFQQMYQPMWNEHFKEVFSLHDGKFEIDHNDEATRKLLMRSVNDNVFQNIQSKTLSVKTYDEDRKFHKMALDTQVKEAIAEEVVSEGKSKEGDAIEEQNKAFGQAIDKILIAHRNTKFFLFCMSWQFFVVYYIVKKIF